MLTSKEVFSKRKEGKKEEAYNMALELMNINSNDDWNVKAFAYCLMDMIKISSSTADNNATQHYLMQLNQLNIDASDDILTKSIARAKQFADPNQKIILEAKQLSKQGNYDQAINLYRQALSQFPQNIELHESLGWELYRVGKSIFTTEPINTPLAKQLLGEYLNLKNERPSLLHSLFLRYADKLIGQEHFDLVPFLIFWNLDNLTEDDFEPYKADNGKIYPSIAEKVIQHAAKDALNKKVIQNIQYILPYVEMAIERFQDNFWLTYYKVKLLHTLNEDEKALEFSLVVVKAKIDQYWAWDLLGEVLLDIDKEKTFSCYCKALQCRAEDKFLAGVRIKFAKLLLEKSMISEAKYEINQVIKAREAEGWKITDELQVFESSDWYVNSTAVENNKDLYKNNVIKANNLLFDTLPWINASLGDTFVIPSKPNKPKRKLFISLPNDTTPIEISVPENKYNFKSLFIGDGLKLKGEYDHDGRFQVYIFDRRNTSEKWDIFPQQLAIIDHLNQEKKIAHFIVDKQLDGIIRFSDFAFNFHIADKFLLRVSTYKNNRGTRHTVLTCEHSEENLDLSVVKKFSSTVQVSNGLGFTANDIFIDNGFIVKYNINNNNDVSGTAVINYNKKRLKWGWKALQISSVN